MKYMTEFRDGDAAKAIAAEMEKDAAALPKPPARIMEFCGGHTISLLKYGIPDILPPQIEMLSGPGCPVCVTSKAEIDAAVKLLENDGVIVASFGDMIRVPGSGPSLRECMALGGDVRVVYSPDDAVKTAVENPDKKVVFFGVGFETTAPVTASAIKYARAKGVENFFVISAHKTTPGILGALMDGQLKLDGFVCPGHVTAITGTAVYKPLTDAGKPCVVSGFEPLDIVSSIHRIVKQLIEGRAETEIQYARVARPEGNVTAQKLMREIFEPVDAVWRGIGVVPGTGLKPRGEYRRYDALTEFGLEISLDDSVTKGCICGEILHGLKKPTDCKLFKTACDPENPVGACMVSDEGTCSIYYRFGKGI